MAQRLERRKQPSLPLHGTVDSWDFPTTLLAPSPIQSVFRRSRLSISLDENDKKGDDRSDERTADAGKPKEPNGTMSAETERETSPSATDSPPNATESRPPLLPRPIQTPSNAPSGVGYVATSAAGSRPSSSWQSTTNPALPAPAAPISESVSTSSNQTSSSSSPPSSPSLWRRIRKSTGHSDNGAWARKHFH